MAAAVVVSAGAAVPAHADDVQVLHGSSLPGEGAFLTYVACPSVGEAASSPQVRINLGPDAAPLGARSLGLVPSAPGSGSGPVVRLDSIGTGTAVVPVHAREGTTGITWAWLASPDVRPGTAWLGRADLAVPAGGWHQVDAAAQTYHWSLVDLATGEPVRQGGPATLAGFTADHGDGPGYVVVGFGCDGRPFNIDALRLGDAGDVTTHDFEGLQLTTAMVASATSVAAGEPVELTASVRDRSGRLTGDPVVLEARAPDGEWAAVGEEVLAGVDAVTTTTVRPEATTEYRWYRPAGEYAGEGRSEPVLVSVAR